MMTTSTNVVRDLEGKVALVVGGSRNQGAAYAELIAARGATTVIGYATSDEAAQQTLPALEKPPAASSCRAAVSRTPRGVLAGPCAGGPPRG